MKSQLRVSELSAYIIMLNNKKELDLYAENMRLLVVSIAEMFEEISGIKSGKEIWILTSSPVLGNLTLRLHKKDEYKKFNELLIKFCEEKSNSIHLICFGDSKTRGPKSINNFYISAKKYYLQYYEALKLKKKQIKTFAKEALDEARNLINKIVQSDRNRYVELKEIPDISIWAYKTNDNPRISKCRAVFYLTVAEKPPMKIMAFKVCSPKLVDFLISIAEAKEVKKRDKKIEITR